MCLLILRGSMNTDIDFSLHIFSASQAHVENKFDKPSETSAHFNDLQFKCSCPSLLPRPAHLHEYSKPCILYNYIVRSLLRISGQCHFTLGFVRIYSVILGFDYVTFDGMGFVQNRYLRIFILNFNAEIGIDSFAQFGHHVC